MEVWRYEEQESPMNLHGFGGDSVRQKISLCDQTPPDGVGSG